MEALINIGITLALLMLGYVVGQSREKKHLTAIRGREKRLLNQPVTTCRPTPDQLNGTEAQMFSGSVVISIDYFKRFASSLRNLVGGRVNSLVPLTERGRREAILRVREQAEKWGAAEIVNLRLSTSAISRSTKNNAVGSVEVLAYATALRPEK